MNKIRLAFQNLKTTWELEYIARKLEKTADFNQKALQTYETGLRILAENKTLPNDTRDNYKNLFECINADICWSKGDFKKMLPITHYLIQQFKIIRTSNPDQQANVHFSTHYLLFKKYSAQYFILKSGDFIEQVDFNTLKQDFEYLSQNAQEEKNKTVAYACHLAKTWIAFEENDLVSVQKELGKIKSEENLNSGIVEWSQWIPFLTNKTEDTLNNAKVNAFFQIIAQELNLKPKPHQIN